MGSFRHQAMTIRKRCEEFNADHKPIACCTTFKPVSDDLSDI
jgi:hypothetical protein